MSAAPTDIVVAARWQLAPDAVQEVLDLTVQLRAQSLQEPGCRGFAVFQSTTEPGELLLLERYADTAAIEAHRRTPHYQRLVVEQIIPRLSQRQIEMLRPQP